MLFSSRCFIMLLTKICSIHFAMMFVCVRSRQWLVVHASSVIRWYCKVCSDARPPPATSRTAVTTRAATSLSSSVRLCYVTRRSNMAAPPSEDGATRDSNTSCQTNHSTSSNILLMMTTRQYRNRRSHTEYCYVHSQFCMY